MVKPKILSEIYDFFLPRICPCCDKKLGLNEKMVCDNCLRKLASVKNDRLELEFEKKFYSKKIISGFRSVYIFEKDTEIQSVIHALKYENRFKIGLFLGDVLGKRIKDEMVSWQIDAIIPIPLHRLKKVERGYNQSLYIAEGLSSRTNVSLLKDAVKRRRFTESQTKLNLSEREKNVKDAFSVRKPDKIKNKNLLLIDDVITTGATINECGSALLKGGAKSVYAASVAIAD